MTTYYRKPKSDTWHWHPKCHFLINLHESTSFTLRGRDRKPTSGDLCNECRAKTKKGKADKKPGQYRLVGFGG